MDRSRVENSPLRFTLQRNRWRSQEIKKKQLGLSIGTAMGRLRKMVLFKLVQETGRDACYRCGRKIESVRDLAIDHKEAWFGISTDLFWDVGNIAFSHALCNSLSRRSLLGRKFGPSPLRKTGPDGKAWCSRHRAFLPVASFGHNRAKWNGLQSFCRACATAGLEKGHQRNQRRDNTTAISCDEISEDYAAASIGRTATKRNRGSRVPEKKAIMSSTICEQPAAVSA